MGAIRLQDEKPDGTGMHDRAQQARTLIHKTTVISPKKTPPGGGVIEGSARGA
jgi:hypothetical protein